MWLFFPYSTDAPIYHWPFATVGIIVANVLLFAAQFSGAIDPNWGWMAWGDGLIPYQWFTSIFVHAGMAHLLGNMVFLWTFGILVEGKVGWWKFLLIYLGIGVTECAIEQLFMLGHVPGFLVEGSHAIEPLSRSCGASSAIFGLVAIALVWAPVNDIACMSVYIITLAPKVSTFEAPVLSFAGIYLGFEILMYFVSGMEMASPAMHLLGAGLGFAVGVAMLKARLVDCEHFDLFTVWAGKANLIGQREREAKGDAAVQKKKEAQAEETKQQAQQTGPGMITFFLEHDNLDAALAAMRKLDNPPGALELPKEVWASLIGKLQSAQRFGDMQKLLAAAVERRPAETLRERIMLAQLLIDHEKRPAKALELLNAMSEEGLPDTFVKKRRALIAKAEAAAQSEDAELELDI